MGVGSTLQGRPVEVAVAGLDQRPFWEIAIRVVKSVQRGERATWGDSEDPALAVSTRNAHPVEVPVGPLDQRRVEGAALVQPRERAAWGNFEDRPVPSARAPYRCPV